MRHSPGTRVRIVQGTHVLTEHLSAHMQSYDVGVVIDPPAPAERGFVTVKFGRCVTSHRFFDDEVCPVS